MSGPNDPKLEVERAPAESISEKHSSGGTVHTTVRYGENVSMVHIAGSTLEDVRREARDEEALRIRQEAARRTHAERLRSLEELASVMAKRRTSAFLVAAALGLITIGILIVVAPKNPAVAAVMPPWALEILLFMLLIAMSVSARSLWRRWLITKPSEPRGRS